MPEFSLPLSATRVPFSLPAARAIPSHATPFADLAATQSAIAKFLPATLARVRAKLAERLPPKPDKNSTPLRYQRVLFLLPDDTRRVSFDPWLAELADGVAQTADGSECPVQGFVLGQLDDPPLGLRLIRHIGEDFCGRFALESHHADREDDHDPEQEGLDATVLGRKTLYVAVRPVSETPCANNDLSVFLARGLLARPLAEILETVALDAVLKATPDSQGLTRANLYQTELARVCAPVVSTLLANTVDAPFAVDGRGEPVLAHTPASPASVAEKFDTVITAAGPAPTDLWFANLVAAAQTACVHLKPGGQVIVLGACDEGLPFPALRAAIAEWQSAPRTQARKIAAARAAQPAEAEEPIAPGLRNLLLDLGDILAHAEFLTFASPGLVPEADDDDSERERRELPPGLRITAIATLEAALASATGSIAVLEI
ncbi:MAG TPA: hypothetical protein VL860_11605 [Planctomycetota bacterium]|nr:hypothetical protein [Planctomycetota bacterium]